MSEVGLVYHSFGHRACLRSCYHSQSTLMASAGFLRETQLTGPIGMSYQ